MQAVKTKPWVSPRFIPFAATFAATGYVMINGWSTGPLPTLLFVVSGWIISLCLHEAAHALVAYWGGDRDVIQRGYLTLDPFAYSDPLLSFGLPLLYLAMGGIGLPGGCVLINKAVLRNRWWDSAVSAAGPAANALLLLLIAMPFWFDLPERIGDDTFWSALAFLGWLQASAVVLNLVPLPGLDGFGIIKPHLPYDVQAQANVVASFMGLGLLFIVTTGPIASAIGVATSRLSDKVGIERDYAIEGYRLFRFRA